MTYKVVTFGNEILRQKAVPIETVTDDILQMAKDMLTTMYVSNGVGLAAEQIGRTESMFVLDVSPAYLSGPDGKESEEEPCPLPMPLVVMNPEITESGGETVEREGCLSFPDIFVAVKRFEKITIKYKTLEDEEAYLTAEGFLARALQHEMDHLNGILLYDHMSGVQKVALSGKLRRLKKASSEAMQP